MKLMKTAEEMQRFCVEHKTGYDSYKYLNHFKVIEDCLQADEYALFCFEGSQIIDLDFRSIRDRRYSCAFTNKRVVMGQNSDMGADLQTVWYKDLNGMELVNRSLMFDTVKNVPCMAVESEDISYVQKMAAEIMDEIKRKKAGGMATEGDSLANKIRKFRRLCDDGIITEEEFQKKKEQLLDAGNTLQSQGGEIAIAINPEEYRPVEYEAAGEKETGVDRNENEITDKRWKVILYSFCIVGGVISILSFLAAAGVI